MCYSQRGSSTFNSTLALTSQQLQLLHLAARIYNPGAITIANVVFGSKPPISDDVLAKAFQVEKKTVEWLQAQLWSDNHK
jgi:hypothetical protein